MTKPFHLFVDKHKGIVKGVLTQTLGPWKQFVVYLSKNLDPDAAGCPPPCLHIIAAVALPVKDADKLTLGPKPHHNYPSHFRGSSQATPDSSLSNARRTHYYALLLNPARITFQVPTAPNLATLLPDPDLKEPLHDCSRILAQVHCVQPDLKDAPPA